jgi:hypothetical protein
VEDIIASSPHPILPTVQGGPHYHTIHSIRKLLRANARSIESHLAGSALGHLGIIVSCTHSSVGESRMAGRAPNEIVGGTAAVLLAEPHHLEEDVIIFRTWTTVEHL